MTDTKTAAAPRLVEHTRTETVWLMSGYEITQYANERSALYVTARNHRHLGTVASLEAATDLIRTEG